MSTRPPTLREHVLEVASRLFYEKGVRNVGIDEIIKESGVARMTLYNNFGSKDQLVKEYLNRTSEKFLAEYREKIDNAASEPRERLVAAFSVLDEWFSSPEFRGCWITNATVEMPKHDGPVREARESYHTALRELFLDLARTAEVANAEELVEQLLVIQRGAIISALLESDPTASERASRVAKRVVEAYLPVTAA
jgi:AcrR family transcriptional regulator